MERVAEKNGLGLVIRDCGLAEYREVLGLQHELQEQRGAGQIGDTVLIVEHPAVITLGARKSANKLLVSPVSWLGGISIWSRFVAAAARPPIIPDNWCSTRFCTSRNWGWTSIEYVRTLEAIGIELLAGLGVQSGRRKGFPGLWVGERKIASIGVRVSRFVTCHGMAINIQNDLSIFELVVPCGLDGVQMTSVQRETGRLHDMEQVKTRLGELLSRCIGRAVPARSFAKGERGRSHYEGSAP